MPGLPPQTIISLPVQTAECHRFALGAFVSVVGVQLSVAGLYRPPVFQTWTLKPSVYQPPQTIISVPVQTAVCSKRASGTFTVLVGIHVSKAGSYRPPRLVVKTR